MNRTAAVLFAACALPRIAALAVASRPDPNFYWRISDSLLATRTFELDGVPTGAYEPLYPLFLAAARLATGDRFALVMVIQALVAAAAGVLLFRLTERATGSRRAGVAAALCYACYPYYVRQSVAPVELTLSVALLIAAAWQYGRMQGHRDAVWLGVWMGLLLLLRAMFAPLWLALVALLIIGGKKRDAAVVASVTLALVLPWLWMSQAGGRSVLPSRIGENLYVSTCEPAGDVMPLYDVDLLVRHAHDTVGADRIAAGLPDALVERAVDDALLQAALACAREHPARTLWLKLRNLAYVFSPRLLPSHARLPRPTLEVRDGHARLAGVLPRPALEAVPHGVAHTAISLAALAGLWLRRRRLADDALLLVMLANTALVYAAFFPTTRLVAPTAFVLMFYAGAALTTDRTS